jgi:hypothetical protein
MNVDSSDAGDQSMEDSSNVEGAVDEEPEADALVLPGVRALVTTPLDQSQRHLDRQPGWVGDSDLPEQAESHARAAQAAIYELVGKASSSDSWDAEAQLLMKAMDNDGTGYSESDCESNYSDYEAEVGILHKPGLLLQQPTAKLIAYSFEILLCALK